MIEHFIYMYGSIIFVVIFEFILFILLIYSLYYEVKHRDPGGTVKRGNVSMNYINNFFSLFFLVLSIKIIDYSELVGFYKTIHLLINLLTIFYLCYFSSWFKCKIVDLTLKINNIEEKH